MIDRLSRRRRCRACPHRLPGGPCVDGQDVDVHVNGGHCPRGRYVLDSRLPENQPGAKPVSEAAASYSNPDSAPAGTQIREFAHAGDHGDIIYALPAIRAAGGGRLILFPRPPRQTRVVMTIAHADNILPLLRLQPYITSAGFSDRPRSHVLDRFRSFPGKTLAEKHARAIGVQADLDTAWLQVDTPRHEADIIFARSPRYHSRSHLQFWRRAYTLYREAAKFVGTADEWEDFCQHIGPIERVQTANLLDVARVIAATKLFVGNQSCPLAIAEGLKVPVLAELVGGGNDNCSFSRPGRVNDYTARQELPAVHTSRHLIRPRIVNVHRVDPNVGDLASSPALYFPLDADERDIYAPLSMDQVTDRVVIVGGGGMFHPPFRQQLRNIDEARPRLLIGWGIGTNTHGSVQFDDGELSPMFNLLGVRDFGTPHRWVPCVSCMSPLFDAPAPPKHRVVVYSHGYPEPGSPRPPVVGPEMTNVRRSFAEVIAFLGSGEIVLTDSYHGVYWATLLGRRVVAYAASSKFHHFRHPPAYARADEGWSDAAARAHTHTEALRECREANLSFFGDVRALIDAAG